MAKLLLFLSFTAAMMLGVLLLCEQCLGASIAECAPHALIALAAVAVHIAAESFVPAYGDAVEALSRFFGGLFQR
jgi:hypothetical protein